MPVAHADRLVDVYTSSVPGGSAVEALRHELLPRLPRSQIRQDDGLRGSDRLFPHVRRAQSGRPLASDARRDRHRQLLSCARRRRGGRPHARAGRRCACARCAAGRERSRNIATGRASFDAAPDVVGRTLRLRGRPFTIVGVTPRGFSGMTSILSPDIWVPMSGALDVEPIGIHDVVASPTGTTPARSPGRSGWMFMKGPPEARGDDRIRPRPISTC